MALHSGGESNPRLSMDVDKGITEPCLINFRMDKSATKNRSNSIETAKRRKLNENTEDVSSDKLLLMEKRILEALFQVRNEITTEFGRINNRINNLEQKVSTCNSEINLIGLNRQKNVQQH